MQRASGEAPLLWGSMVGFGHDSYRTESGHEGEMFLIETWDAPGSRPSRRSDFRLPEGARRLNNPAAFGLGQIPEGHVPYLAPQGTIHLFKDPRGASTFAPSALNEK